MLKKLRNKWFAGILGLGILGAGISANQSETKQYWQDLSGYYSTGSQIELQPKLVILQRLSEKSSLNSNDIKTINKILYSQIPQDLELIKNKYQKRIRQLEGKEKIEISPRTHEELSREEIKKRANKNLQTLEETVPDMLKIYIGKFNKISDNNFKLP